jgi:ribonucleoside-diphosphate reductase alpha chain
MVLEISVLMAAFPSKQIAELSWKYRTLGLGYANLGAMLMQAGIPYDSDEGRAICACLTAILTGRSPTAERRAGGEHGRSRATRTTRRTCSASSATTASRPTARRGTREVRDLRITPGADRPRAHRVAAACPLANARALLTHATKAWDDAYTLGTKHGFRNAQTTVIAPTGTIGLLMDCDTTGVEPDFALVKFKKLAGGGYFKIANNSVEPALKAWATRASRSRDPRPTCSARSTSTCRCPPTTTPRKLGVHRGHDASPSGSAPRAPTTRTSRRSRRQLPGVFELKFAFSAWGLGDETLARLGLDAEKAKADFGLQRPQGAGPDPSQIEELNRRVCGTQTVEGAPHLRDEHLPVFDCANTCGKIGTRFIAPEGHIRMMGAAQPFITGAISKTINLPHDASVEDIKDCYRLSWELGLKANALYRDGCKLSQPLNSKADADLEDGGRRRRARRGARRGRRGGRARSPRPPPPATPSGRSRSRSQDRPPPDAPPPARHAPLVTHKFNVAGHEGYLTVGLYDDGMPGELFITMAKEGSTIGGLMDSLGTATERRAPVRRAAREHGPQVHPPAVRARGHDDQPRHPVRQEPRRLHLPLARHGVHPRLPRGQRPAASGKDGVSAARSPSGAAPATSASTAGRAWAAAKEF